MTPALREACKDAMHVVRADGTVLRGGRAALHLLEAIGHPLAARTLATRPLVWGVEGVYEVVARNRPVFARFFFTKEDPEAEREVVEGK